MEEKSLLKFTTAIPFPLLVYKVNVRYNEVRKASGVAYILLDVIEKTAGSEDKICDVLLKFGIPRDLRKRNFKSYRYRNTLLRLRSVAFYESEIFFGNQSKRRFAYRERQKNVP